MGEAKWIVVSGSPEAVVGDVGGETHCLHCFCPRLHFSTWLLSLAASWPVNKVSQRAPVHGSARQQEQWDRDESRPCLFPLLSARIGPRLVPLLVWLRRGRDLQRLQILQVPLVIKQSNMSKVDCPQQPVDRTLVVATQCCTSYCIIHSVHLQELELEHQSAFKCFILAMLECSNSEKDTSAMGQEFSFLVGVCSMD